MFVYLYITTDTMNIQKYDFDNLADDDDDDDCNCKMCAARRIVELRLMLMMI